MAALRSSMRGSILQRQKLLGVGKVAVRPATAANLAVEQSGTLPAIERYTGVLYGALDAKSLPAPARRRLDARVLISSGLWGAVAPSDPIPDYKLKMGASLPRLGKLSTWWRSQLDPTLDNLARGRVVWDLRPGEHAASWRIGDTPISIIDVKFLEERPNRGLVTVSHWNKLLKGALTRHLVTIGNPTIDCLSEFTFEGFGWEPDSTTKSGGHVSTNVVRRL